MVLSDTVRHSMEQSSWIRRMFEEGNTLKARYGENNVFDLTLGNPIMEPPVEFCKELEKAVVNSRPGMHRYMSNAGYTETRKAVAEYLAKESDVEINQNDIIMTCGAAGALNVVLKTLLNPGDEVVIFAPFFAEYVHYIHNHNGIVNTVVTDEKFMPRLSDIERALKPNTKAVIINSPNNPSGAVYTSDFIHDLGVLLEKKSIEFGTPISLISDEAYRYIVYDGTKCPHIWKHYKQSIVVNSYSKDLALPGERIGYIAVHPELEQHDEIMAGMIFCNRVLGYVNAPALMQNVITALQGVTVSINEYRHKRDLICDNLISIGYKLMKPLGAFYVFPESPLKDDVAFVKELSQHRVLVVPGSGFGYPGHFRISYCVNDSTLEGSLEGFSKIIQKYK